MRISEIQKNGIAVLFYGAVLFVFFYKAVLGGYVFGVGDFSGSDLLDLHLPFKYILADSYKQHEFPLWTPYLANGFPLLAEGQSGALYPPNIIFALLLPPYLALNYSVLLAFVIAGFGAYLFVRRVYRLSFGYALFVGLVFMLCSFFIARIKHLNMIVVAAYLPWALWCVREYFVTRKLIWFFILGIIWSLQLLAGHPHMFYLTLIMVGWFICVEMLYWVMHHKSDRQLNFLARIKHLFLGLLLAGVIGVGLAAPQILATAELAVRSSRVEGTFLSSIAHPLDPKFLATFLSPYILGNPADGTYNLDIVKEGIWWENVLYIGIVPLLLVLFLMAIGWRRFNGLRDKGSLIDYVLITFSRISYEKYALSMLLIGAGLFLYWAMGRYSILYMISYYGLPGMSLFRFPTRFSLYTLFALAIVSGFALRYVLSNFAVFKKNHFTVLVLVFIVVLGDFYLFSSKYISFFPVSDYLPDRSAVVKEYSDTRIYPMTQYARGPYGEKGWFATTDSIYALQRAIPGNFSAVYGLQSFSDRGWFEGGLSIKERNNLERTILEGNAGHYAKLLGLWNVGTIFSFDTFTSAAIVLQDTIPMPKFFGGPLYIYSNSEVYPRAYFTGGIHYVADEKKFIQEATASAYSPYSYVFSTKQADQNQDFADGSLSEVSIVASKAQYIKLQVQANDSGYVVLSDTFYPGWEVLVDGIKQLPLQVNLVQRAVKVERGEHIVEWRYRPQMFYTGIYISLSTGVGMLLFLGYRLLRRRG